MAWIYLAESEETLSVSETTLKLLLIVKEIDTLKLSSYHEWLTAHLVPRLSGMTLQPLTRGISTPRSILLLAASPARTLALQERVKDWKESEADFFLRSCAWPKKSSPLSYSLRTSPLSEPGDWISLSKNLPRQGMTVDGRCYPLKPLVLPIKGNVGFVWPTPTARDWKSAARKDLSRQTKSPPLSHTYLVRTGVPLSPNFCEWLMGFPIEWTALSDLGTQWFRSKPKKHLKSF